MLHIITILAMATAIALGIYLAYFPYEEGSQYLVMVLAVLVPVNLSMLLRGSMLAGLDTWWSEGRIVVMVTNSISKITRLNNTYTKLDKLKDVSCKKFLRCSLSLGMVLP
ncbi:hypothetical protein Tco_0099919 [Tanacetum coccineum]